MGSPPTPLHPGFRLGSSQLVRFRGSLSSNQASGSSTGTNPGGGRGTRDASRFLDRVAFSIEEGRTRATSPGHPGPSGRVR
eukprot:scaffold800_cov327-Pavlova_lutheri.AAC.10